MIPIAPLLVPMIAFGQSAAKQSLTATDCAVYEAVFRSLFAEEERTIMVMDTTKDVRIINPVNGALPMMMKSKPPIPREIAFDFQARNQVQVSVKSFKPTIEILFKEAKPIESLTKNGKEWKEFYRKFPKVAGYVWMSLPGYDSTRTQSITYTEFIAGGGGSFGVVQYLKKESGKWKVVQRLRGWAY